MAVGVGTRVAAAAIAGGGELGAQGAGDGRCSGSVTVIPLAQTRSWVATICSAQVTATSAGVAIQSTNRPIARGLTE